MPKYKSVAIIVPVYGDWASLSDCIDSLLLNVDTQYHKVLLVNDCGPEADSIEKNIKKKIKGKTGFKYYRNPKNLGFLKNCNRAVLELAGNNDEILLLNSDTEVTEGFVENLLATMADNPSIGTISPRTNNATIATIPIKAAKTKDIKPEDSYEIFEKYSKNLPEYNISPVAHGFCILIRRNLIDKIGLFDEVFGKGYGEEVDFCMRARKIGYENAICNRAYVYHLEARSFGFKQKSELIKKSEIIIDKRYPSYKRQVRDYARTAATQEFILFGPKTLRLPKKGLLYASKKLIAVRNKLKN